MNCTWPSEKELNEFRRLRQYVFAQIEHELMLDDHHKSYEGHMAILFPHYFMENYYLPEQQGENWGVHLDCYVLGPHRHYDWYGRALGEAVQKARKDIDSWMRES